ncbi:MAG: hypothetical protein P8L39_05150 [Halioglobus sp.]|nr:hypothetical protein [Halioglobus sp.]
MESDTLLRSLLDRGDAVCIENGRLRIEPVSGRPVPSDWLAENSDQLIRQASARVGLLSLIYETYSTGKYTVHSAGGVTLQLASLDAEKNWYVIFNAELVRARKSRHHKPGSRLPSRRFRVLKGSHFVKFWKKMGLKMPPRLSSFYDYMGNLKGLVLTADPAGPGTPSRLDAGSLRPLEITYQQLLDACQIVFQPDNFHTSAIHSPDNSHTEAPYNELHTDQAQPDTKHILATCENNCGSSKQGGADIRKGVPEVVTSVRVEDQSVEEWLMDYGN